MNSKEPVLLVVLIETGAERWYVAGVSLAGEPIPLMRSKAGDLHAYVGAAPDEQVNFLRHRLSGVLQRGSDRLWGRQKKPCQIVFVADDYFTHAPPELTQQVADHFDQWMVNPPVVFFVADGAFSPHMLKRVAGAIESLHHEALETGLPALLSAINKNELWELSQRKPNSHTT